MTTKAAVYPTLKDWILQLDGLNQGPHRFGGTEFQVNGLEFMHSHGESFLDIRLSMEDQAKALKDGVALPHRFAPQAGWVSFRLRTNDDLESAKQIIRLAYENARKIMQTRASERDVPKPP